MELKRKNRKHLIFFLVFISLIYSCAKCPTVDQLQGTWYEQTDNAVQTKLIFQGNSLMYYFHPPAIDTLSYSLDTKHKTIFLNFYRNPNNIGPTGYTIEYHKRKKIMTITGLTKDGFGNPMVQSYKQ